MYSSAMKYSTGVTSHEIGRVVLLGRRFLSLGEAKLASVQRSDTFEFLGYALLREIPGTIVTFIKYASLPPSTTIPLFA